MLRKLCNGEYAMTITGSYARGTIQSINPNLEIGVFPLPNDTYDDTKCLSGIDAAICVSAQASDKEKMQHIDSFLILLILKMHRYSAIMTVHHPVSQVLQAMMMESNLW